MSAFASAYDVSYDTTLDDESTVIPPPVLGYGPIEGSIPLILERVAKLLHDNVDDEWLALALDAAIIYVITDTAREELGLPDDSLTITGLVQFTQRIYLDTPNGAQVAIGDPTFEPIFQPEHLYKHVRHYFKRLKVRFGVA